MKYILFVGALGISSCFNIVAVPVSEIAEFGGVQCAKLIESVKWKTEIQELLNGSDVVGKPYLNRVSEALGTINQAQVDSKTLYDVSSIIRMSVCDFPIQYQSVLRKIVINLSLRAAMEGEKEAIYDIMDMYPSQNELEYVNKNENEKLSIEDFGSIRENLADVDIGEIEDIDNLKKIVKDALSRKSNSAPTSPVSFHGNTQKRETHSDSELYDSECESN